MNLPPCVPRDVLADGIIWFDKALQKTKPDIAKMAKRSRRRPVDTEKQAGVMKPADNRERYLSAARIRTANGRANMTDEKRQAFLEYHRPYAKIAEQG